MSDLNETCVSIGCELNRLPTFIQIVLTAWFLLQICSLLPKCVRDFIRVGLGSSSCCPHFFLLPWWRQLRSRVLFRGPLETGRQARQVHQDLTRPSDLTGPGQWGRRPRSSCCGSSICTLGESVKESPCRLGLGELRVIRATPLGQDFRDLLGGASVHAHGANDEVMGLSIGQLGPFVGADARVLIVPAVGPARALSR